MKNLLIILFCIVTFTSIKAQNKSTYYEEYFPEKIEGLGFGLSNNLYANYLEKNNISHRTNDSKIYFLINYSEKPYTSIAYKFDGNLKVLIELEIIFPNENSAISYLMTHFSTKANETFKYHPENNPYATHAWRFKHKIFFIGMIPKSRWESYR